MGKEYNRSYKVTDTVDKIVLEVADMVDTMLHHVFGGMLRVTHVYQQGQICHIPTIRVSGVNPHIDKTYEYNFAVSTLEMSRYRLTTLEYGKLLESRFIRDYVSTMEKLATEEILEW